ncbi:MAG: HNH endonuclease [Patescibacteria group bacterium]
MRHHTTRNGKHVYTYLHRVIANALPGVVVDHVNSNSLDCRRENLHCTSVQENARRQNHALQRKRGF